MLLCKGCVAQHYYKTAATYWFYYTINPVNGLFSLMITMSYGAILSCIQEALSFFLASSDYHVLRTLCSIMARPWVWFRWCDLVHKKALPASFLHHVIRERPERILLAQADSLILLRRPWSRRNIVSLQSNISTIWEKPNKINGLRLWAWRVRMGQAPLTSYMYMAPTQNWVFRNVYQWRRVHRVDPLRQFLGKIKASKGFTP